MNKEDILKRLHQIVSSRIEEATQEIESINRSKANETKSSAGDKYETGMAMLQQEEQKANVQLAKARELEMALSRIDSKEVHSEIQLGSLVDTSNGIYFISIGLGKLEIEKSDVFVLSITSPLGMQMKGMKVGDQIDFRGQKLSILRLI